MRPEVTSPDELARTASEGAAMGLDEVVAYALEVGETAPTDGHGEATR